MMRKNRDGEYLAKLKDYYARNGVLPSFTGVATLLDLKATSTVSGVVDRLKKSGHLASTSDRRLMPGPRFGERAVMRGGDQPGSNAPDLVEVGQISIDRMLIDEPSRTFLLIMKGSAMAHAGIQDGDTVVVKRGAPGEPGQIVVAMVDGDFSVGYLAKDENGTFVLKANAEAPEVPEPKSTTDEVDVVGRVIASFRRYD